MKERRLSFIWLINVILITLVSTLIASPSMADYSSRHKNKDYKNEATVTSLRCLPLKLRDGLYVGAALGYDAYRIRQSVSVVDVNGVSDQANPAVSLRGIVVGAFAGYGAYFDQFYIAGELVTNYTNADAAFNINQYNSHLKAETSYGADILPGLKINDTTLLYARIGYLRTFFKMQENGMVASVPSTTDWGNGLDLGLGIETAVYQHISMRAEYRYTSYNSFSSSVGTKFTPSNSEFMLGALYRFDFM